MKNQALLTSGEFSQMTGVPVSTLIYYDRKGLFHPAKRGENDFRYYSYFQMITIKLINVLKTCGVPLKTIKAVMKDRSPEVLLELLLKKEKEIPKELERLHEAIKVIHVFANNLCEGLSAETDHITTKFRTEERYSLGIENDFSGDETFYGGFIRYCRDAKKKGRNMCYPVGGWWSSMDAFMKNSVRPERFFSLDPDGEHRKPAGRYLIGNTQAFYGEINDLPEKIIKYAAENNLKFDGPVFNIFLLDEISTLNPDQYLLQASVMVK